MGGFGRDGYEDGYPGDGEEEGEGADQGSQELDDSGDAEQDGLQQRGPGEDLALHPGRGAVSYDGRATPSLSMWGNGGGSGDAGWPGHAGPRGGSLATSACPSAEHSLSHWPGTGRRSNAGVDRSASGVQQQQQQHGSASAEVSAVWDARDGAEAHREGSAGHADGSTGSGEVGAGGSRSMGRHVSSGQSTQQPQGEGSQDGEGAAAHGQERQGAARRSLESSLAASFASSYTPRGRDSREGESGDGGVQGEAEEGANGEAEPGGPRGGLYGSGASASRGSVSVRGAKRGASVSSSRGRQGTGGTGGTGGGDDQEEVVEGEQDGEDEGADGRDVDAGAVGGEGDVDGVAVVAVAEAAPQGPVLTPGAGYRVVTSVAAALVVSEDPREAARHAEERELEAALQRTAEHSGKVKVGDGTGRRMGVPGQAVERRAGARTARCANLCVRPETRGLCTALFTCWHLESCRITSCT